MGEIGESSDRPFEEAYKKLFNDLNAQRLSEGDEVMARVAQGRPPVIDLNKLNRGETAREECKEKLARAAKEWGVFYVVNHEIPWEIWVTLRKEQEKLFEKLTEKKEAIAKAKMNKELISSEGSSRSGSPPFATLIEDFLWVESFHFQLSDIYRNGDSSSAASVPPDGHNLGSIMRRVAMPLYELAQKLAGILAEKVGKSPTYFQETCLPGQSYIRLKRYPRLRSKFFNDRPPCSDFMTHKDYDFLTILHQDDVPGLQIVSGPIWLAINPYPGALIVNTGELFKAWSNDVYKSVLHRTVTNPNMERFPTVFFFCPSDDSVINPEPSIPRRFRHYKKNAEDFVRQHLNDVGLARLYVVTDHDFQIEHSNRTTKPYSIWYSGP
ncbi:gibberellin 2-beta-dioxygenase 8-like [Ipomoea triloba]|uniref:gibberellin 2-beta-dioxygenase 8-like n=1 Tax=Ipomoea triloba TaxID=35885 RepID=UPI00125E2937|nr:gibberellin 2-beta-dioxygenase 8-like [Ipomoea triloba]